MLEYNYFKDYYKMTAIDLKQQTLDNDPKAMQQILFIRNLNRGAGATMFFLIEEETVLDFSRGTVKVF